MNIPTKLSAEDVEHWNEVMRTGTERELAAFREMLPDLLGKWRGWFVAICDGQMIDKDRDEFALAKRVSQKRRVVLIQKVESFASVPVVQPENEICVEARV